MPLRRRRNGQTVYSLKEVRWWQIQLTYPLEVIRRLKEIPKEREVLFVNATQQMAREAITQLEQRGVNQLRFIPYGPDSPIPAGVKVAVTPDEPDLVPPELKK